MATLNNDLVGIAAQDRARMRGENKDDRVAELEARVGRLERALAYQMQIPRDIVIISNDTYVPVTFDTEGHVYIRSQEDDDGRSSIDIGRRPHARIHVMDLLVNIEWIKARLLEDTDWLDEICQYCDTSTPPAPWPGGI